MAFKVEMHASDMPNVIRAEYRVRTHVFYQRGLPRAILLITLLNLNYCAALQAVDQALGRNVYALVIGVSAYGDFDATANKHLYEQPRFVESAEEFAKHLKVVFPESLDLDLKLNKDATRDAIMAALYEKYQCYQRIA
jgi:hypothetical protein